MPIWQSAYLHEIQQGQSARLFGNEGRARVCARRAAGILIGEYLARQGLPPPRPSAYDRLRFLASQPDLSPAAYQIAAHLLVRVDESFSLPEDIDLLADVLQLAHELSLL